MNVCLVCLVPFDQAQLRHPKRNITLHIALLTQPWVHYFCDILIHVLTNTTNISGIHALYQFVTHIVIYGKYVLRDSDDQSISCILI